MNETSAGSYCPTVSLEEFVAVGNDNVCTEPNKAGKDILEFVQGSKDIIDADYDNANQMNNEAPVPTSSEMKNVMKSIFSYLDAHSMMDTLEKGHGLELMVDDLRVVVSSPGANEDQPCRKAYAL
ncbi:hypothetical protein TNCV_2857621 [Trichonephila clavipes]|nr:hypothetical protein TNCV_2857621 [Trichonephila clavipes]